MAFSRAGHCAGSKGSVRSGGRMSSTSKVMAMANTASLKKMSRSRPRLSSAAVSAVGRLTAIGMCGAGPRSPSGWTRVWRGYYSAGAGFCLGTDSDTARPLLCIAREEGVGKAGLEPARLAAHDPKSCSAANYDTSPGGRPARATAPPVRSYYTRIGTLWLLGQRRDSGAIALLTRQGLAGKGRPCLPDAAIWPARQDGVAGNAAHPPRHTPITEL